jgi:hypothetical protein
MSPVSGTTLAASKSTFKTDLDSKVDEAKTSLDEPKIGADLETKIGADLKSDEKTNTNIKNNKKEKKTPNSLIIFVKTRIPNYFKMN